MKGKITIIFNDTVIGSTNEPITFHRDTDSQIEYRITDLKRDHVVSLFTEVEINFIPNPDFTYEKV